MSEEHQVAVRPKSGPVIATERGVQFATMGAMYQFAQYALSSGLAPKHFGSPEAVMIAMQTGMEVGLSPMQAIQSIAVINGRPSMWGDACLAVCMGRPDFEDCIETWEGQGDKRAATCQVIRKGRHPVVRTFSMADADRAGLAKKAGPWTQYPDRMLQMRARGFALRDAFPDALKGIGIGEEVRDYAEKTAKPAHPVKMRLDEEPKVETPALPEKAEIQPNADGEFEWEGDKAK